MKKLAENRKAGSFKIQVEHLDDLWYLKTILNPGDRVSGKTLRKIGSQSKDQRAKEATKKPVFLKIQLEKIEFSKTSPILRAGGKVVEGPEDVPLGSHHTFNIEENTQISIQKEQWLTFQLDKLYEAFKGKASNILVVVHDREDAYFALLKKYGYDLLSTISGNVQKKGDDTAVKGDLYTLMGKQIQTYIDRHKLEHVVVASPAFFKEDFMKTVSSDLKKKIITATCSSVSENAITEVLKRPEVKEALKQERSANEVKAVEQLFAEISKEGLAVYGIEHTKQASDAGAVSHLLVADQLLYSSREDGSYEQLDSIMKTVDANKGEITLVSADHDGGKQLMGVGGIGALLRYKTQ